jgi:hypothetical protein
MSSAARSLRVFAIYLVLIAVGLLIAPNAVLRLFSLPETPEVWIRVVGMLVSFLGVYYWVGAASESVSFFRATVLCRLTVPLFFLLFVTAGWVQWQLLLFAPIDMLGAAWTWQAIRRQAAAA